MSRHTLITVILLLADVLGVGAIACGQEAVGDSLALSSPEESGVPAPPTLLIMPVVNYSEKGEAHEILLPLLHEGLDRLGFTYLTTAELRPLLREHRIRSRGWIGLEAARILRDETAARYLLLASWDVFRDEANPEIALSVRILDLEQLVLVGSVSQGLTGADFTKALGLGTVSDIRELAGLLMDGVFASLFPLAEFQAPERSSGGCFQIALIPFDNYSGTPNAGDIMTNIVLSRLLDRGYFVVEPGFVRELGLTLEVINRGGVDRRSAESILANFDACWVMTGTVETFAVARGAPTQTVPELALGIRLTEPHEGTLYMMEELGGAGDDGDGMFQVGRTHSLVTLTNKVLADFLEEVTTRNREDILHGDQNP